MTNLPPTFTEETKRVEDLTREEKSNYASVHYWLRLTYGKASTCENVECDGRSKQFNWAKLRGKPYAKDRKNFAQMCVSCHHKYDMTEAFRQRVSRARKGKPLSAERRKQMSRIRTGWKHTQAEKDKIGRTLSKPVLQLDENRNVIKEWSSRNEAARALGINKWCISGSVEHPQWKGGGYYWKNK